MQGKQAEAAVKGNWGKVAPAIIFLPLARSSVTRFDGARNHVLPQVEQIICIREHRQPDQPFIDYRRDLHGLFEAVLRAPEG